MAVRIFATALVGENFAIALMGARNLATTLMGIWHCELLLPTWCQYRFDMNLVVIIRYRLDDSVKF